LNGYAVYLVDGNCGSAPQTEVDGWVLYGSGCDGVIEGIYYRQILPVENGGCSYLDYTEPVFQNIRDQFEQTIYNGSLQAGIGLDNYGATAGFYREKSCEDNLSELECEQELGVYYASNLCADNPCD
jgi:hypothetical protein